MPASNKDIGYISAHGSGHRRGDIAESHATRRPVRRPDAISSLKSYFGHTWGLRRHRGLALPGDDGRGLVRPTLNLNEPDPACPLDHVRSGGRMLDVEYLMSNNFAFGGIQHLPSSSSAGPDGEAPVQPWSSLGSAPSTAWVLGSAH